MTVAERMRAVRARITDACIAANRSTDTVRLLAVSKTHAADTVRMLHMATGQRDFGENYVQEAIEKQQMLTDLPLVWHFIGRIQTNKCRMIAAHFDWVHTVTRPKEVQLLAHYRRESARTEPLRVFLQINIDEEQHKSGIFPSAWADMVAACREAANDRVCICGIMVLPTAHNDFSAQRVPFARARALRDAVATDDCPLHLLSFGMSADLEAAIYEGADWVRVGTALFGMRVAHAAHTDNRTTARKS